MKRSPYGVAIISVSNLTYQYEQGEKPAVNDVTFDVQKGDWIAIIGHNGSGKSTLAKLLIGLLPADSGIINIDGTRLTKDNVWEIRETIGMVFQNPDNQFVGATVADDVAFGMENRNIDRDKMVQRVENALLQVGMWDFRDRVPEQLSGGQKQRVSIAGVVAIAPKILILDESTSMLDPEGKSDILTIIKDLKEKLDLTVLSITHDINEAAQADKILVINDGYFIEEVVPQTLFEHGSDLIAMGLDVPFSSKLTESLMQYGVALPTHYLDEGSLADWLWKLSLTK